MELEIIQVFMLNESAIQKPTKFQAPHWRRSGSTGLRSRLVSMSCAVVRPGSLSTASLSPHRLRRAPLARSMACSGGAAAVAQQKVVVSGTGVWEELMDPGCQAVSGTSRRSPEASLGTRRLAAEVCVPKDLVDGAGRDRLQRNKKRGHGGLAGQVGVGNAVILYIYRTIANTVEPGVHVVAGGLRAGGRATDRIPTPKTTLPL